MDYLYKATELDPQFADAWSEKGVVLSSLDRYEEAVKASEKALEINPKSAKAWFSKALGLGLFGERRGSWPREEIVKCLTKATELDPQFAEAWFWKGHSLVYTNSEPEADEEAIKAFDKVIELNPNESYLNETWFFKARALADIKKYEDAIKAYDKSIELKTINSGVALYEKGCILLIDLKKYDEAAKVFDKLIESSPSDGERWYYRACAYSGKKDRSNALVSLTKAVSLNVKFKEDAKNNEIFQWLRNDEEFKRITE